MRGRTQAAEVALVGNWVPLMAPGAVALVTLRAGAASGLLVLDWALLTAALTIVVAPANPIHVMFMIIILLITFRLTLMLRLQAKWSHYLLDTETARSLITLSLRLLPPSLTQTRADARARVMPQF